MSEENETREKILQQLTPASMRIMLISHIQREAVSFIEILFQTISLFFFENPSRKKLLMLNIKFNV
jgi:hypothetical protein